MRSRPPKEKRAAAHGPIGLCVVLLVIAVALPGVASAASNWQLTQLPAKVLEGGYPEEAELRGIDCPTDSLCVAAGGFGTIATSTSPTGGRPAWRVAYEEVPGKGAFDGVSCASESLCVVVGFEGGVAVSTDPTGGAAAWSFTNVNVAHDNAIHLTGVSCPSTTLCVASGGANPGTTDGKILTTTEPTSGQWQTAQLDPSLQFTGVSCSDPTLCVAVARGGKIAVSSDPTGGASAWKVVGAPGGSGDLEGIDCVATLCATGNATGNILTSTEPTAAGATWSEAKAGIAALVTGVSCPTTSACVGVDNNGSVFTSTDATGGSSAWHAENLVPFEATPGEAQFNHNALFAASCSSTSLCALVGSDSRIFTSATPFAAVGPTGPGGGTSPTVHYPPRRPQAFLVFAENFWRITRTHRRHFRARFHFYSPTPTKGFECKRDQGHWRRCHSPLRYRVGLGHHTLRVRAIGPTGLRGEPAVRHFRIEGVRAGHRHRG
ncbi:MAG TPA: hypothetical protein VGH14_14930 [Solirubrobacterales bacterium]|jgi:hypothetical protein